MANTLGTSQRPSRRKLSLRRDSSVGSAEREIERVFGLPKGSVQLINPNHRKARSDKLVGTLVVDWGW